MGVRGSQYAYQELLLIDSSIHMMVWMLFVLRRLNSLTQHCEPFGKRPWELSVKSTSISPDLLKETTFQKD